MAYSIAIIVWVYLATTCKRITSIGWLSLGIIIIGGSLTISKTFILGGFPLAMLYWFWNCLSQSFIRKSTILGMTILSLSIALVASYLAKSWIGLHYFLRFFNSYGYEKGVMHLLTGSRFGSYEPSVVLPLFLKIWNDSPLQDLVC